MFFTKLVEAADTGPGSSAGELLIKITAVVVNPIIILFFIMATVLFAFGIFEFVKGADDDTARTKGKQHMIWGIVGIFIMTAVFAIIEILKNLVGTVGTPSDIWIIR